LTEFGTPFWELRLRLYPPYGGNVGGYSALFSYILNLQLGEGSTI